MRLYVLFGCEPSRGGRSLGTELLARVRTLIGTLREDASAHVFFAEQSYEFLGVRGYSALVRSRLTAHGISDDRMHCAGSAENTLEEIIFAEKFLAEHPEFGEVTAVSTWYHLPRIRSLWHWWYGRRISVTAVAFFEPYVWWRAALELPKFVMGILPAAAQRKIGRIGANIRFPR